MTCVSIRTAPSCVVLFYALLCTHPSKSQTLVPAEPSEPPISIRISTEKHKFHPGEEIRLHVEIWNVGKEDVFISKDIQADFNNLLAYLDLTLYYGSQAHRPATEAFADCFCSERSTYPPLATELSRYWIAMPPKHFYGGEVVMSPLEFRKLKTPGKYRIQGKYESLGFLAENINNPLLHYADELKRLPYKAWVGAAGTNSIWIEVTKKAGRANSHLDAQSPALVTTR